MTTAPEFVTVNKALVEVRFDGEVKARIGAPDREGGLWSMKFGETPIRYFKSRKGAEARALYLLRF